MMQNAKITWMSYRSKLTLRAEGKWEEISHFIDDGFDVEEEKNDEWTLIVQESVTAQIENIETKEYNIFDITDDLRKYYNQKEITLEMFNNFRNDLLKIRIGISNDGQEYSFEY